MKNKFLKGLVASFAVAVSGFANAGLITFESLGSTSIQSSPLDIDGYKFELVAGSFASILNGTGCSPQCAANGTVTLAIGGVSGSNPASTHPLTLSNLAGEDFSLLGFDFAEFFNTPAANATTLTLTGLLSEGGSVSQIFTIDQITDGTGGANDFQTAALDSFWGTASLSSLQFVGLNGSLQKAFSLDNISLTTEISQVPEPSTLAIFALGIIGLASRKFKKQA